MQRPGGDQSATATRKRCSQLEGASKWPRQPRAVACRASAVAGSAHERTGEPRWGVATPIAGDRHASAGIGLSRMTSASVVARQAGAPPAGRFRTGGSDPCGRPSVSGRTRPRSSPVASSQEGRGLTAPGRSCACPPVRVERSRGPAPLAGRPSVAQEWPRQPRAEPYGASRRMGESRWRVAGQLFSTRRAKRKTARWLGAAQWEWQAIVGRREPRPGVPAVALRGNSRASIGPWPASFARRPPTVLTHG
jgi:hypothetical protein